MSDINVRGYNFAAGPAALPLAVLEQAKHELLNWQKTGASVMEVSHRSKEFIELYERVVDNIRYLLDVPLDFEILLLSGGARAQFAAVPLNIMGDKKVAAYAVTGHWSREASIEAAKYLQVNSVHEQVDRILPFNLWDVKGNEAYLHYCDNETISGVEFSDIPNFAGIPTVSDMTSSIFTKQIDFTKIELVYAAAQKNFGIAGTTLVIVKKSLLSRSSNYVPSILDYSTQLAKDSMYNTPVTFSWYIIDLYLKWMKEQGGLLAMQKFARDRSERLYSLIDQDNFYINNLDYNYRSRINVVFNLADKELEKLFLQEAEKNNLVNLQGHKLYKGVRASMYNGISNDAVNTLLEFMADFKRKNA